MDYRDRLTEIFGSIQTPSLRTIFDCDSEQWKGTVIEKKISYLEKLILSGHPLDYWVKEYTKHFQTTHKHSLSAIKPSLTILVGHVKDEDAKKQIKAWLENN